MIRVQHNLSVVVFLSSFDRRPLSVQSFSFIILYCSVKATILRLVMKFAPTKVQILCMQCFPFSLLSEWEMIFGMFPFLSLFRFVLLLRAIFRCKWAWGIGGMTMAEDNRSTWRKTCQSATLPNTKPTWTQPELIPVVCGERQATNRPSHGTAPCSQTLCL